VTRGRSQYNPEVLSSAMIAGVRSPCCGANR
jgi:hypothetical protein